MKKVIHTLDFGIFPGYCLFTMGMTYDEIIADLKKGRSWDWINGLRNEKDLVDSKSWKAMRRDIENPKTGREVTMHYIIIPGQFRRDDEHYTKLAHEVLHITQFCLPDVLNRNMEHEAEAYLHTHLMRQILKIV